MKRRGFIIDKENKNIAFYKKQAAYNLEPVIEEDIRTQLESILSAYFKTYSN